MDHSVSQSAADSSEKADDADDDDSEFAEVDPTGRYGRYNEVLGKGAVKTVYRAFDKVDGIEVAWNQVTVHDILQGSHNLERLYSEVHLLKSLKHKNIIKFYNSWVDTKTENVNFITEIFTSGNLRQYRRKHKHVNMKAVKNWARQILRGLLYLHSHDPPIIHRDLKCDNIFVNGNYGEVKIGDLGLAAILQQAHAAHSVIGTPEFMAPELYEEEYDELVDIYSFGMCVLEMVTFEYPYSECTNAAQIYKKVTSGRKPAALEKVKDPQVHSFIGKCLAAASHRLPARELLMDPFLQSDSFLGCSEHLHSKRSIIREDDVEDLANSGGIPNKCPPLEESSEKASNLLYSEESKNEGSMSQEKEKFVVVADEVAGEEKGRSRLLGLDIMTSLSTNLREENPQKSSFRVQGKRRENETIFLRLRIGDREGHFRNIHFPFDMDADSALCVASEMVAELDLSDQDVTTIAEMIDTEIITFMPDWKPGAAFEDFNNIGTEEEEGEEEEALHLEDLVETESPSPLLSEIAVVDATHSEEFVPDSNLHSSLQQTHSIEITSLGVASPCHGEATLHGRFEEYTYQSGGSDHSCRSELHLDIVNCLCDTVHVDGDVLYPETDRGSYSTVDTCDEHLDHPMNLLILRNEADMQTVQLQHVKNECGPSGGRHLNASDSQTQEALAFVGIEKSRSANPDEEEDEETVALELSLLAMRQEQELRELQSKHEKALQEIRNRKSCKGSSSGSPRQTTPNGLQADSIEQNIIEEEIASLNSTGVPSASCEALSIRE